MNYTKLIFILAACVTVIFAGCSKDNNPETYTITVTFDDNGTAEADKATAKAGEQITLTAMETAGYVFEKWTVESGDTVLSGATDNPATFTMPAKNVSIKATFIEIPTYTVTVTSVGGSAGADKTTAKAGEQITLTATETAGYVFEKWTVESGDAVLSSATDNPATFTMPAGDVAIKAEFVMVGVTINGVRWAASNVDAPGTFAANSEDFGMLYQWNRRTGWKLADPLTSSPEGETWDPTHAEGDEWEAANDPCPDGWRVPTHSEQVALCNTKKTTRELTTINTVNGFKFTDIESPGNSIFLPFAGICHTNQAGLSGLIGCGFYWSATKSPFATSSINLTLEPNGTVSTGLYMTRDHGVSVRCVADTE